MNTHQQKPKLKKKNIANALQWIAAALAIIIISALAILQTPYVQNRLGKILLRQISQQAGLNITHQKFRLHRLSKITLGGITIKDKKDAPLLTVETLEVRFNIWQPIKLLLNRKRPHTTKVNVKAKGITLNTNTLTDQAGDNIFTIKEVSTITSFKPGTLTYQHLQLQTRKSLVKGNISISYDTSMPLEKLYQTANIAAHIDESTIASEELAVFAPHLGQLTDYYHFSGTIEGTIGNLQCRDFQFDFANLTNHLEGDLHLKGMPHAENTLFDMRLKKVHLTTFNFLAHLVPTDQYTHPTISHLNAQAHIHGKPNNFTIQSTCQTNLGQIHTDIKLKIAPIEQETYYSGKISADNLDIGKLLNQPVLHKISAHGQFQGQGINWKTAKCQLTASIKKLTLDTYTYRNIHLKSFLAQAQWKSHLSVQDNHLQGWATTNLDMKHAQQQIKIQGSIEKSNLQALQLTSIPASFQTQFSINLDSNSPHKSHICARLHKTIGRLGERAITLDKLTLEAQDLHKKKVLTIDSELGSIRATGSFNYATLPHRVHYFFKHFTSHLRSTATRPPPSTTPYHTCDYTIHLKNINPLLHVLAPNTHISPGTHIKGNFTEGPTTTCSLHLTEAKALTFQNNTWHNARLDLIAQSRHGKPTANIQITAEDQQWGRVGKTKKLSLNIDWKHDQVQFKTKMQQATRQREAKQISIQGRLDLLGPSIKLVLDPKNTHIFGAHWCIDPSNRIVINDSNTHFEKFEWTHKKATLSLNGILGTKPDEKLTLKIRNLSLDTLSPLLEESITGCINATATLTGGLQKAHIDSRLVVDQLTINNSPIGTLHTKTAWNHNHQQLLLETQLHKQSKRLLLLRGHYTPHNNCLSGESHFNDTPLAALAPLANKTITQLSGKLTGRLSIKGQLHQPRIHGTLQSNDVSMKVIPLQTLYQAQGKLTFCHDQVNLDSLTLTDDRQGQAQLKGSIAYTQLHAPTINLQGTMHKFKLLNNKQRDNPDIYGTSIISGSIALKGPIDKLNVDITSTTEYGTKLHIPINSTKTTYERAHFIHFAGDRQLPKPSQSQKIFSGMHITLLLNITPDALATASIDNGEGGTIKGRGEGTIRITINNQEPPKVVGSLRLSEGEYHFSLYQIISKTFKILPDSKITWHGDPTKGIIDIKAAYEQHVSLAPLVHSSQQRFITQKYPVQAVVKLSGKMLAPDMNFQVNFVDPPINKTIQAAIHNFQSKAQDQAYLEQQIISLVMLKKFSDEKIVIDQTTIARGLGEAISKQLDSLLSSLDEHLEVETELDPEIIRQKGLEGIHLKIGRRFLNGRLRICRSGKLGNGQSLFGDFLQLLGDWTLEYLIIKDGTLKVKARSKQTIDSTTTPPKRTISSSLSLLYKTSFDYLSEIFFSNNPAQEE